MRGIIFIAILATLSGCTQSRLVEECMENFDKSAVFIKNDITRIVKVMKEVGEYQPEKYGEYSKICMRVDSAVKIDNTLSYSKYTEYTLFINKEIFYADTLTPILEKSISENSSIIKQIMIIDLLLQKQKAILLIALNYGGMHYLFESSKYALIYKAPYLHVYDKCNEQIESMTINGSFDKNREFSVVPIFKDDNSLSYYSKVKLTYLRVLKYKVPKPEGVEVEVNFKQEGDYYTYPFHEKNPILRYAR